MSEVNDEISILYFLTNIFLIWKVCILYIILYCILVAKNVIYLMFSVNRPSTRSLASPFYPPFQAIKTELGTVIIQGESGGTAEIP
jgi:hypothetical protein